MLGLVCNERLKGYNVALKVFDRPQTFYPAIDPIVRIEAARLREKLREYYENGGHSDLIRIELPKGTYTPRIKFRRASEVPSFSGFKRNDPKHQSLVGRADRVRSWTGALRWPSFPSPI